MGAHLVSRAVVYVLPRLAPNRHDRARVVLLAMCHTAHDKDERPAYFAGSAHLAELLGFAPDDEAGERAVSRAIKALEDHGIVERIGRKTARGVRRWELTFAIRPLADSGPVDGR